MSIINLAELWTPENLIAWQEEELHPDLVPYVCDTVLGKSVKHPLIFDLGAFTPGLTNLRYLQKKAVLERCIEEGNIDGIIAIHERAYRLEALYQYVLEHDGVTGEVIPLWYQTKAVQELAEFVWTDSENIHQNHDKWLALYAARPEGGFLGDAASFRKLPDPVTLWRGGVDLVSWSTKRSVAEFFANRFVNHGQPAGAVRSITIPKSEVFAYYTGRGEYEALTFVEMNS